MKKTIQYPAGFFSGHSVKLECNQFLSLILGIFLRNTLTVMIFLGCSYSLDVFAAVSFERRRPNPCLSPKFQLSFLYIDERHDRHDTRWLRCVVSWATSLVTARKKLRDQIYETSFVFQIRNSLSQSHLKIVFYERKEWKEVVS